MLLLRLLCPLTALGSLLACSPAAIIYAEQQRRNSRSVCSISVGGLAGGRKVFDNALVSACAVVAAVLPSAGMLAVLTPFRSCCRGKSIPSRHAATMLAFAYTNKAMEAAYNMSGIANLGCLSQHVAAM